MSATWLVSAESSRARVFSVGNSHAPLWEVNSLLSPAGRLHEQQLRSDNPGRTFDSKGKGRHAKEAGTDAKDQESIRFAKRIAEYLESNNDKFNRLIVAAAPAFLGLLRKHISDRVKQKIVKEFDKNIVRLDVKELEAFINK